MKLPRVSLFFLLIVTVFSIYAALFIRRTSFTIDGKGNYVLFDDAMISMRYARNLVEGNGLVWNPGGERVEGYTNPLWVLYMALFHLLPLDRSVISLYIQVSAVVFLLINLIFVRQIVELISRRSMLPTLSAVLFTAFYLPLNNWSLQGMEVSVLTLMMTVSAWNVLRSIQRHKFPTLAYILLGLGTLVRIDVAVPLLAITTFLVVNDPQYRRRHAIVGVMSLLAFLVPQSAFRLWYYGDLVPNTYYLKVTGYPLLLRVDHGLKVAFDFMSRAGWFAFALLLFRRDKQVRFLFWLFLAQVLYSIYVGGDAWEDWGGSNRYICIAMPLFFVLLGCALAEIRQRFIDSARQKPNFRLNERYIRYGIAISVVVILLMQNAIYGADALSEWLLFKSPLHVDDNILMVARSLLVNEITTPQAKIATVWAGITPYFADRTMIDMLGKNDKKIAHQDMDRTVLPDFWPGHMKWDYEYSIGELKPDVVLQLWRAPETAYPYLSADYVSALFPYFDVFLRKDSPNILWDKVKEHAVNPVK